MVLDYHQTLIYSNIISVFIGGSIIIWLTVKYQRLQVISYRDYLTGLYNRRYLEEQVKKCISRQAKAYGFIVCDVDGLKNINDKYGHITGDEIILAAAQVLKSIISEQHILTRIGGDEFVIFLPVANEIEIKIMFHNLDAAIRNYNKQHCAIPLSLSYGSAMLENDEQVVDEVLKLADSNMYKCKMLHRK